MSLKKVLMLSFAALAAGGSLSAQNLIVGADFATPMSGTTTRC